MDQSLLMACCCGALELIPEWVYDGGFGNEATWAAGYDAAWNDLNDGTDQPANVGGGGERVGMALRGDPPDPVGPFSVDFGAWGLAVRWNTGALYSGLTITSASVRLEYDVEGTAAWDSVTLELRLLKNAPFAIYQNLEADKALGAQKTTWSVSADGAAVKTIPLVAGDLAYAAPGDYTELLLAPLYNKPARPGTPALPQEVWLAGLVNTRIFVSAVTA